MNFGRTITGLQSGNTFLVLPLQIVCVVLAFGKAVRLVIAVAFCQLTWKRRGFFAGRVCLSVFLCAIISNRSADASDSDEVFLDLLALAVDPQNYARRMFAFPMVSETLMACHDP